MALQPTAGRDGRRTAHAWSKQRLPSNACQAWGSHKIGTEVAPYCLDSTARWICHCICWRFQFA